MESIVNLLPAEREGFMSGRRAREGPKSGVSWDEAQTHRPSPSPLSRERIVAAAVEIADRQGLESVSLRNVGAALAAGPMRLYGHVSTKEQLLELMVDAVYGEMVLTGRLRGDWRKALRSMARRTRKAAHEHPWFVDLLGGRPRLGPNALAYLEASLASLSGEPGFDDIDLVMQAAGTVHAYVLGAVRNEASELRARVKTGRDESQWQADVGAYIERVIATGRYPTLEKVVREATHPSLDVVFDEGLELVLDGIAARLRK
jgi:AcrR family transcriptional regulator